MNPIVNEILEKIDSLPCNFHIAIKVSKMLEDFNVSIDDLSEVIGSDQSLTLKILKLSNSAEYGFSRKITTVKDAIARIGFKPLKTMVFTIVSKSSLNQEVGGYGLEKGDLWKNSITCACYSRYFSDLIKYSDSEQAFTAGLLKDIGKLVLHEYIKTEYDKIADIVNDEKITFCEAEERVLGINHSQIGAVIAEKWNFPQVLVDTIKYHHNPEEAEHANCEDVNLIKIVHIADYFTSMLGQGIGKDCMMQEIDLKVLEGFGFELSQKKMEALISDLVELNSEIESMNSNIG